MQRDKCNMTDAITTTNGPSGQTRNLLSKITSQFAQLSQLLTMTKAWLTKFMIFAFSAA